MDTFLNSAVVCETRPTLMQIATDGERLQGIATADTILRRGGPNLCRSQIVVREGEAPAAQVIRALLANLVQNAIWVSICRWGTTLVGLELAATQAALLAPYLHEIEEDRSLIGLNIEHARAIQALTPKVSGRIRYSGALSDADPTQW